MALQLPKARQKRRLTSLARCNLSVFIPNPLCSTWSALKQQNKISDFLDDTVQSWIQLVKLQLKTLFDGSDASIEALYSIIDNAAVTFSQNVTSAADLKPIVEKALYGYMIPNAWAASTLTVLESSEISVTSGLC